MSLRILLIEDNAVNLDVQSRMLGKIGHGVTQAADGKAGLTLYEPGKFDLVFIDWQMPGMDGVEVAAEIRKKPSPPVIVVLSGHAMPGDREELLAKGFDDYLSKPVRISDFRQVLDRWFPPQT